MENTEKKKNLLDLEYHTELSNKTTLIVLLGTLVISIILSNLNKNILWIVLLFIGIVIGYYYFVLNRIKNQIRNI